MTRYALHLELLITQVGEHVAAAIRQTRRVPLVQPVEVFEVLEGDPAVGVLVEHASDELTQAI